VYLISGQELCLWRDRAISAAIAASISTREVDWLLKEVTNLDSLALYLKSFQELDKIEIDRPLAVLSEQWQQRLENRLPVQYLVGSTPWRNFTLKVSPDVLIPRPETELIVDLALEAVKTSQKSDLASGIWVDLGTGSGAIALGLAEALTKATVCAVDRSEAALAIAAENAQNLGLERRIKFYCGSWWQPLAEFRGKISAMVSNPPYIPTVEIAKLQPEVVRHEPSLALDGGEDGLESIRHLIDTAPVYLHSGGIWLIEFMAGQAEKISQMLAATGNYKNIKIYPDLAGIDRFALAIVK